MTLRKWQYWSIEDEHLYDFSVKAELLGRKGWEMVSSYFGVDSKYKIKYFGFFKKPYYFIKSVPPAKTL